MGNEEQTTFEELMGELESSLEKAEEEREINPNEKLSITGFTRLLVYYFVSGLESGRQLIESTKSEDEASMARDTRARAAREAECHRWVNISSSKPDGVGRIQGRNPSN